MAKRRRRRKARHSTVRRRRRKAMAAAPKKRRRRRRRQAMAAAPKRRRRRRRRAMAAAPKRKRRRSKRRRSGARRRRTFRARGHRVSLTVNPRRRRRRRRSHARRRRRGGYRRNPIKALGGGLFKAIKAAVPFAASLYGARVVSRNVDKVPGVSMLTGKLGQHAQPVVAVGLIFLAHFVSKKVRFLAKHRTAIMVGVSINAVDTLLKTYLPSVAGYVGAGNTYQELGVYPMNDYVDVEDYIDVGDYVDVEDYEELGDYEEMGTEYELGDEGTVAAPKLQIGTGIGSKTFLKQLPRKAMVGPVPNVPMVANVPAWAPSSEAGLYTGIFSGGKLRCW